MSLPTTLFGQIIPEVWLTTLARIQDVVPHAVLAGGCLRDLVLGGAIKDLDVFVPAKDGNNADAQAVIETLAGRLGWTKVATCSPGEYSGDPDVVSAVEYQVPGLGWPLQVISLTMPGGWSSFNVIRRMDFAACQMFTTGYSVGFTNDALTDITTRRITLVNLGSPRRVAVSLSRGDRFRAKYADLGVIVDTSAAPSPLPEIDLSFPS